MPSDTLPPYITALLDPAAHNGAETELKQTHISHVILAGDRVYKFKKPVDFGFLDFSTLEKRKACCEQELLLNRRLCPDIYLELVSLTSINGGFQIGGSSDVVEYGVCMQRMPEECMMNNLIREKRLNREHIDAIIKVLLPFYEQAETSEEINTFGTAEAVAVNVIENFDQTRDFIGTAGLSQERFDRISDYARDFLTQEESFQIRINANRIRDCHGDLYSANICLGDKIWIYDCIEFNQRFRYCDVASDAAFLAMDLDFHGLDGLSEYFISSLIRRSDDAGMEGMLNFYKCYRAFVRGKIALFTANDPAIEAAAREPLLADAGKYFDLAERYALI